MTKQLYDKWESLLKDVRFDSKIPIDKFNFTQCVSLEQLVSMITMQTWNIKKGFYFKDICLIKQNYKDSWILIHLNCKYYKISTDDFFWKVEENGAWKELKKGQGKNNLLDYLTKLSEITTSKPLKTLFHHYDSAHGWIKVTMSDLFELGVKNRISGCSYMKSNYVYLEEDGDATSYCNALVKNYIPFEIKSVDDGDYSRIRNYPSFDVNRVNILS